ncbi:uncharacterized protein C9orf153 homolog [Myotis myotis]|uniref:Uncharacterized protein n=1 Tax=Myotis myotis TaxID=51298 RepID=A0A7J7UMW4_MYOMY|nr:uncharacterized protein C9orf153 homolog [Myotis myotis]KAF6314225.1 hypothetical protein mMyoMyo1_001925 [Myotis myotis]
MFTNSDTDPSNDDVEAEFPRCSLPELYALAENFHKESKKSNHLKTFAISPSEARRTLSQALNAMAPTSRTDLGEDSQSVVRKDKEKPPSMTELLHRSLLTGSPSQVDRLEKSQERLAYYGIPPPLHTFPYEIILSETDLSGTQKKFSSARNLSKISISKVKADKFLFEDRITEYSIIEPEKQFMDLRDLEWKYYKGITKWTRKTSDVFAKIQYNSEKRFVKSKEMPGVIFPPLVRSSLVVFPKIDFPPNLTSS